MNSALSKTRDKLKAQWLSANKRALAFREKANEAGRRAAALQKALDALEEAMGKMPADEPAPVRRPRGNSQAKIVDLLQEKGPLSAQEIATHLQMSYGAIINQLKKGPFRSEKGSDDARTRNWSYAEGRSAGSGSIRSAEA